MRNESQGAEADSLEALLPGGNMKIYTLLLVALLLSTRDVSGGTSHMTEGNRETSSAVQSQNVEVFITPWCGYCKKMIEFLDSKGIRYTAYNIEKDRAAMETHRKLGGRGVPLVRIGEQVVYGYNPDAVLSYLGRKQ